MVNYYFFYNIKTCIDVPCHNYNTRLKFNTNVIVPKINTVFEQQSPKYKFITFCIKYNFNIYDFNSFKMYKKYINNVLLQ